MKGEPFSHYKSMRRHERHYMYNLNISHILLYIINLAGQVGGWQTHLSKEEVAAFEEWESKHLQGSDLKFIFTLPSGQSKDD